MFCKLFLVKFSRKIYLINIQWHFSLHFYQLLNKKNVLIPLTNQKISNSIKPCWLLTNQEKRSIMNFQKDIPLPTYLLEIVDIKACLLTVNAI